ncbi:DUF3886 domain-containing protein [Bacillaceae bacterium Marseille-Q3522]|nr:DUF3886 domain-containing protein [Bacillaceae bacterium Marseille-Q3522]
MKKQQNRKKDDKDLVVGDLLNQELIKQLQTKKKELKFEEEQRKLAVEKRKREERRLREKHKSFAELFEESDLDWKKYK